jgi:hypothetical protein
MQQGNGCLAVLGIMALGAITQCVYRWSLLPFEEWMEEPFGRKLGYCVEWLLIGGLMVGVFYLLFVVFRPIVDLFGRRRRPD